RATLSSGEGWQTGVGAATLHRRTPTSCNRLVLREACVGLDMRGMIVARGDSRRSPLCSRLCCAGCAPRPAPVVRVWDDRGMNRFTRTTSPRLLFLDLETGGLDARSHEILELGAVLTSPDGTVELGRIDVRVRPLHPERISECAQAINGYSAEGWDDARPLGEALTDLVRLAQGATLVGHNICFDWGFILTGLRDHGLAWTGNGRYLDTMALAPRAGALPNRRLLTMASHLGISTDGAHHALVDAAMCRSVFLRLAPRRLGPLEVTLPAAVVPRTPMASDPGRHHPRWRRRARSFARLLLGHGG
ncbi:MAG: 3'-5' exonuclease, partial [Candidatus Dormibacteria bacterium]